MKKLLVLFMAALLSLSVISIGMNINTSNYVNEAIQELQPSPAERYMTAMLEVLLFNGEFQFVEVGQTVVGTVESWGYSYLVIEVDRPMTLQITTTIVAGHGEWDLNVYLGAMAQEYDFSYEELENGDIYTLTVPVGFLTLEFDSYSEEAYPFSIIVNEVI